MKESSAYLGQMLFSLSLSLCGDFKLRKGKELGLLCSFLYPSIQKDVWNSSGDQ